MERSPRRLLNALATRLSRLIFAPSATQLTSSRRGGPIHLKTGELARFAREFPPKNSFRLTVTGAAAALDATSALESASASVLVWASKWE